MRLLQFILQQREHEAAAAGFPSISRQHFLSKRHKKASGLVLQSWTCCWAYFHGSNCCRNHVSRGKCDYPVNQDSLHHICSSPGRPFNKPPSCLATHWLPGLLGSSVRLDKNKGKSAQDLLTDWHGKRKGGSTVAVWLCLYMNTQRDTRAGSILFFSAPYTPNEVSGREGCFIF